MSCKRNKNTKNKHTKEECHLFFFFYLFKLVMCILVFTCNKKAKRKEESCNPLYTCLFMWPTPCLNISCLPFVSKITAQLLLPAPHPPLNHPWKTPPPSRSPQLPLKKHHLLYLKSHLVTQYMLTTPLEKTPPAPHLVDVIQSLHALQTYAHKMFYFAASVLSSTRILWCSVYVGWRIFSSNRAIWTV